MNNKILGFIIKFPLILNTSLFFIEVNVIYRLFYKLEKGQERRGGISTVYDLSTVMLPASQLGHCTKERVKKNKMEGNEG